MVRSGAPSARMPSSTWRNRASMREEKPQPRRRKVWTVAPSYSAGTQKGQLIHEQAPFQTERRRRPAEGSRRPKIICETSLLIHRYDPAEGIGNPAVLDIG